MSQVDRNKLGRNDPCWCESGKKYKHCHRDRSAQEKLPYHSFANDLKKSREGDKRCFYPLVTGTCSGSVIRAHSISRSSALTLIARNGHVYQPNVDPFAIERAQGEILHHLVGINSATTFTGFCSLHDQQLFKPIDTGLLLPTPEQVFLLHYRALCRELYVKKPTLTSNSALREVDRGRPNEFQAMVQGLVSAREISIATSLKELDVEKAICDAAIRSNSFADISALVLYFDEIPTIACSGHTQPIYDFTGSEIQDIRDMNTPLAKLSFTLLPNDTGGIAVIAWLKNSDPICRPFASTLLHLPDSSKCPAIVQWVFDSFENHAFQPQWWESLSASMINELKLIGLNWTDAALFLDSATLVPVGTQYADWKYKTFAWI